MLFIDCFCDETEQNDFDLRSRLRTIRFDPEWQGAYLWIHGV